jgi:glycosyltransferase involved in cell wall biosynthesis
MTQWLFSNVSNYDVVHTHAIFSYPVLVTYWMCQIHKITYIATPHGMLETWALAYKSWKKKIYFTLLEKPALQKARAIQMISYNEVKQINNLKLKTNPVVVSNGIHSQDFEFLSHPEIFYNQFPETKNKKLIIFLGRIDPKKGLNLLAPAFAQAYQKFPNTHLIIAGPDNTGFLPTAESYFIKAGCRNGVTFTGMLTGSIKYAALAAAKIYVAPSYSEGFSLSVLEGMAAGLPCIITTGCNFPEAGEAKVASIVNIDVGSIADAIIKLLEDDQKAKNMGNRARQFILENYTWDKVALKMVSVYKNIVENNVNPKSFEI